jgi:cytoskeleton protein RodZ
LREARIGKGLTIKDVEDATKIRGKYLEALEENDFNVLPGATCVIGFLRNYASFLKLDADNLVQAYKTAFEPRTDEPAILRTDVTNAPRYRTSTERRKQRLRRQQGSYVVAAVIAIIIVALLAWFSTGRGDDAASLEASSITSSTMTTSAPLVDGTTTRGSVSTEPTAGDETDGTVTSMSATAKTTSGTADDDTTVLTSTEGTVKVVVKVNTGTCWLVIREDSEDGAEIFAGTLSAGGKQTFDSSRQYWIMAGNPDALSVSVAGKTHTLDAPSGSFLVTGAGIERIQ